ncbi:hypothetical protein LTR70_002482 [Exophiala xenobiotica]|uniref:Clr5 domain-containing protein n=1 Tax=Lithohypha guttulata TaxID=1690604 RepID=A0ABR0KJT0_9EURO|nr:hypothetical protein LTR24_001700 [Lithohypha guttulata]KAK5325317.1 hypothetical protein LTR70_002482 [Exophiala xenobiotica]
MSFKVNVYDPKGQAYAPRIRAEEWERHKDLISHLHAIRIPRKAILKRLRDDHNFSPTLGQLQAKCKEWNLKVYAKDGLCTKSSACGTGAPTPQLPQLNLSLSSPAFHLVTDSGYVEEWSDDYRVHPSIATPTHEYRTIQDRSLPAVGLLANTVDSHWPVPEDGQQCESMLQAAHYYHAITAFQQAFSIYRAVYLYQRRLYSICDPVLIRTVLFSASSAVTDHQRNIVHSVLSEMGSDAALDNLSPLYVSCLQAASLSMISSDSSCDVEAGDLTRARASAYLHILYMSNCIISSHSPSTDIQAMLYKFEHLLLMQEHDTRILQHLLSWCESVIDRLHREVDDIFVGHTRCENEYYHRVGQVLSGYLLSQWHKPFDEHDHPRAHLLQPHGVDPSSFYFHLTTTQTLVALAFMVVDSVRCDPLASCYNKPDADTAKLWFLDAAKLFKRGIRMLCRLDEKSRCAVFSETFLERFYTSVSFRQKAYGWSAQLPAIVDSVGMSLAQQHMTAAHTNEPEHSSVDLRHLDLGISMDPLEAPDTTATAADPTMCMTQAPDQALVAAIAPGPQSDCNSISSFILTYQRTLKRKHDARSKSGRSTPGDVMSLSSSAEFRFGMVGSVSTSDVDSFWRKMSLGEPWQVP